jgi:plasmid stabilization system protein ParE
LLLSPLAETDLVEIAKNIARDNRERAERFAARLEEVSRPLPRYLKATRNVRFGLRDREWQRMVSIWSFFAN